MSDNRIFALDIGTHKVAGLIMEKEADQFHILHTAMHEQLNNAMQDGQIHDIPKVAQVIRRVRDDLSEQIGQPLTQAAVAAAGRSLLTQVGRATKKFSLTQEIDVKQAYTLELTAARDALEKVSGMQTQTAIDSYLCIGYTVTQRYLDDQPIQNLVGHQGYSATLEVIATFLPRIVIDSLATALRLADLEMASLTLEPIAAIHTVVPESMRMLNLSLVDIGAGTSDIAITADGTIRAYGMIPEAGDLITKTIASNYLLDFSVAEEIKHQIATEDVLRCYDVLGNPLAIEKESLVEVIDPTVTQLATKITEELVALNEGVPKGVMLIGGGSLTTNISQKISQLLQVPQTLVRIRERNSLTKIFGADDYPGPQLITPICIGCNHIDGLAMQLHKVEINEIPIQFLRLASTTIGDALLAAGYTLKNLGTESQQDVPITINGKQHLLAGKTSITAKILCNNQEASLSTQLLGGEQITYIPPSGDQNPTVKLNSLLKQVQLTYNFTVNEQQVTYQVPLRVNGQMKTPDYQLRRGDNVEVIEHVSVGSALQQLKLLPESIITVTLNSKTKQIPVSYKIIANGNEIASHTPLTDHIKLTVKVQSLTVSEVLGNKDTAHSISVNVDGQDIQLNNADSLTVNGTSIAPEYELKDGDQIEFKKSTSGKFILSDIFRFYQPKNLTECKRIRFFVNDEDVGYTHQLHDGDVVRIYAEY